MRKSRERHHLIWNLLKKKQNRKKFSYNKSNPKMYNCIIKKQTKKEIQEIE